MVSKQRNMINFTVVCVNEFAQKYNIDVKEAFQYLFRFEGIRFIKENYDAEHILPLNDVIEDVEILCKRNGGLI